MTRIRFRAVVASLLLFVVVTISGRAAEFVKAVPNGALGFIAVRNIAETDAKLQQLSTDLKMAFGGPLAFLQMATGINEGLDKNGDALLLILPSARNADEVEFSLWLPVADYDRFVTSLGGMPGEDVAAVNVAGEDLLVMKHGGWAVLFDPDARDRIPELLKGEVTPPRQVLEWERWMENADVVVVALRRGLHAGVRWASTGGAEDVTPATEEAADDDIFGPAEAATETEIQFEDGETPGDAVLIARKWVRDVLSSSPKLLEWTGATDAIGIGLRIDEQGNARAGLRVALRERSLPSTSGASNEPYAAVPSLYESGEFVLHGAGELPSHFSTVAAQVYAHLLVRDLKTEEQLALDRDTLRRFQAAVEQAARHVQSFAVLTKPVEPNEGVYTNHFLAVRVPAADRFVGHVGEVMRLWNEMNREAQRGTRLVFDVEETTVAERTATLYSIDIAAADGAPELPEIRQAMEKLFGPGGKFQLLVVPVDGSTVLLAVATPPQTAAMVATIGRQQPVDWAAGATSETNPLLPAESAWRLFFSPHGYTEWLTRQMDAITGPVIGGPIVKRFPPSPPIGAAGGMNDDGELWAEVVVPAKTIQSTPDYRKRPGIQLQR